MTSASDDDEEMKFARYPIDLCGLSSNADIGEMVMMSTNRTGAKSFLRPGPLPWREVTVLSGESNEDGSARLRVEFHDEHGGHAANVNRQPIERAG